MFFSIFSKNNILSWSIICFILFPVSIFAGVQEETSKGDMAFKDGKIEEAEAHYSSALKMDPNSWRIMRGLAETKFRLKKYRETKDLVDRIRAMKVIKRNIEDYYKEDIMIKQKLNTERNKMWTMMGKFGKKLKV